MTCLVFADIWTIGVLNTSLHHNNYNNSYIGLLAENSMLYPNNEVFNNMKLSATYNSFVLNSTYKFATAGKLGGGIGILTSGTGLSNQYVKFVNAGNYSADALSQVVDFGNCNFVLFHLIVVCI